MNNFFKAEDVLAAASAMTIGWGASQLPGFDPWIFFNTSSGSILTQQFML